MLRGHRRRLIENGLVRYRMDSRVAEPRAGSFMKTLKLEAVYKMGYKTFEDVTPIFHGSSIKSTTPIVPLWRGYLS
jgi:hypothetical protein